MRGIAFQGWAAAVLSALVLAACVPGRAGSGLATVAGGAVVIAAPRGFCVDTAATRDDDSGSFVLMAGCAALTRQPGAPMPAEDAIVTASVAPNPGPGGSDADRALVLSRYFGSEEGRAALARDGVAANVVVDRMFDSDGLFFLHARDRGPGLGAGLRDDYWRAVFAVEGRIVTATVVGFVARPLGDEMAQAMLRDLADRSRAATDARADASGGAR